MPAVYSLELENALDALREARRVTGTLHATVGFEGVGFEILHALAHAPGRSLQPHEIARGTRLHRSEISHGVTRMIRRAFVTKRSVPGERRRAVQVTLTDAGAAAYQLACKAIEVQS